MIVAFARERSEWEKVPDRADEGPFSLPKLSDGFHSPIRLTLTGER
jgi:hypothetical protein